MKVNEFLLKDDESLWKLTNFLLKMTNRCEKLTNFGELWRFTDESLRNVTHFCEPVRYYSITVPLSRPWYNIGIHSFRIETTLSYHIVLLSTAFTTWLGTIRGTHCSHVEECFSWWYFFILSGNSPAMDSSSNHPWRPWWWLWININLFLHSIIRPSIYQKSFLSILRLYWRQLLLIAKKHQSIYRTPLPTKSISGEILPFACCWVDLPSWS